MITSPKKDKQEINRHRNKPNIIKHNKGGKAMNL